MRLSGARCVGVVLATDDGGCADDAGRVCVAVVKVLVVPPPKNQGTSERARERKTETDERRWPDEVARREVKKYASLLSYNTTLRAHAQANSTPIK